MTVKLDLPRGAAPELIFQRHYEHSSASFWRRFGGQIDVSGKRVLDFGCGTGGMVHRLMTAGASSAVGIDLSRRATDYARERLGADWGDAAEIICGDVREQSLEPFDLIVSQNTLEHVLDLPSVLDAVVANVVPGGDVYFGFSPLWHSPFGHHQYPSTRLPWHHLLGGDQVVLDAFERTTGAVYRTVYEAGFNKATPKDFRAAFDRLPVELVSLRSNVAEGWVKSALLKSMTPLARIPPLEKYLVVGMYAHLRRL